jgi:hypothetical protein
MVSHRPPRSGATRGLVHGGWRPVDRSARHRAPQHRERVFSRCVKRVREGVMEGMFAPRVAGLFALARLRQPAYLTW